VERRYRERHGIRNAEILVGTPYMDFSCGMAVPRLWTLTDTPADIDRRVR
jgi:hypothetical protein